MANCQQEKKKRHVMHGLSELAGQGIYSVLGLRNLGLDAEMVVWEPNSFVYPYDKKLGIDKNKKWLLPYYALRILVFYLYAMFRYNTFHFHFGRSMLLNYDLWFLKFLRKRVVYEFHGSDMRNMERAAEICGQKALLEIPDLANYEKRNARIFRQIDTVILHDDELIPHLPSQKPDVYVVPLRVDVEKIIPAYPPVETDRIRIVHAPSNRAIKGTSFVIEAVERLKKKYPIDFILVEGMPQAQAQQIYQTADIIVDQLLLGIYSVVSIEGMALGKPVIDYIMDSMKDRYPAELPIVSADPETVYEQLKRLVCDGALRNRLGRQGRIYAETYHNYKTNAKMLEKIYDRSIPPVCGREAFAMIRELGAAGSNDRQTKD